VASIREYWEIYRALAGAHVRARLQYRLSFWLGFGVALSADLVWIAQLGVVLARFPSLQGWTWREIALLFGLGQMANGILRCFGRQVDNFDQLIVSGEFDTFLVRPLPPMFHLLAARFEVTEVGRVLCGLAVLGIAAATAGVAPSVGNVAVAVGAVVGGALLWFSVMWMVATLSFWHTRTGKLQDIVQGGGRELVTYPLGIYPSPVRALLTYILPFALITYYPAQRLLGRAEESPILSLAALPAGLLFLLLAALFWRKGLKHYQSTGS
jgi:ABC-2 type transport system permease protein